VTILTPIYVKKVEIVRGSQPTSESGSSPIRMGPWQSPAGWERMWRIWAWQNTAGGM